jgi:hypothetical protein
MRYIWIPKGKKQLQQPLLKSKTERRNQIRRTIVQRSRYLRADYLL